jgi:hypothetical protein
MLLKENALDYQECDSEKVSDDRVPEDRLIILCLQSLREFGIGLRELDKKVCRILDERAVRFISKFNARLQYGRDLARLRTSQRRLTAAIQSFNSSEDETRNMCNRVHHAGLDSYFHAISLKRHNAFKRTRVYQSNMPRMLAYYKSIIHTPPSPPRDSEGAFR